MRRYVFILGREPELSVAEIVAVAQRDGWPLIWREAKDSYALVEGELPPQLLKRLAGTIKIAEVIGPAPRSPSGVKQAVARVLEQAHEYADYEFGISLYGARLPWLGTVGMNVKRELKGSGKHVRFVISRDPQLSSVVVQKRRLLPPHGFEFVLVPTSARELLLARTIAVQEFAAWSERDYGRPARDARVGMLPPKLARIMVNLAQVPLGKTLLDPFCGSGTVLQEAAVLGYQRLTGMDADQRGVERTRTNFAWLAQKVSGTSIEPKLLVGDIRRLPRELEGHAFDAVVTEPYLGPPLRGRETLGELQQIASELFDFYRTTLKVLARLLTARGRIVMVWPVLRTASGELALSLHELLPKIGLRLVRVLPPVVPQVWHTSRGTLRYERPDARVGREIVVLERIPR